MAVADNRQRRMPLPDDRSPKRSEELAYPEAVLLVNPVEPEFKGEVYLYPLNQFYHSPKFLCVPISYCSFYSLPDHYFSKK